MFIVNGCSQRNQEKPGIIHKELPEVLHVLHELIDLKFCFKRYFTGFIYFVVLYVHFYNHQITVTMHVNYILVQIVCTWRFSNTGSFLGCYPAQCFRNYLRTFCKNLSHNLDWDILRNVSGDLFYVNLFFCLKVGFSPSKRICVICLIESPLKMIKNAF